MGLYMDYRGRLKTTETLPELVAEVKDIAETMEWPYELVDEDWERPSDIHFEQRGNVPVPVGHAGLKGIIFRPEPGYDPIYMTFTRKGRLATEFSLAKASIESSSRKKHWLWAKTSHAPDYVHVGVCKLLKYLAGKYFRDFKVEDQTGFWDSNDEQALFDNQAPMRILVGNLRSIMDKDAAKFLEILGIKIQGKGGGTASLN